MHDYLQIIGVAKDASYREIRRAAALRVRRPHPDFVAADPAPRALMGDDRAPQGDVAIDFVHMARVADRMRSAFFGRRR